jgi:uncharacterized protein (TIGR02266 family)
VEAGFRVSYRTLDELVVAYTRDLSRGGLFLKTQRFLPINAVILLSLELPEGGGEVPVIARVAYVRDPQSAAAAGKTPGMGIQFLDVSSDSRLRIERFIAERAMSAAEDSGPIRRRARPLDLLVVDDDESYRELAAETFRARGENVRVAADGVQGLGACLKQPPELILSDVQMPGMDGWQLLRIIRARPTLATTPVIFMSTLAGEEERLRGYKLGVDDFIAKPFRPEELVARVDRVVSRSQRSPGAIGGSVDKKSLRGDLEQVGLPSVLSFLEMERKTGILLVIGDRPARLYLRDGRPLRVEIASPDPRASQEELALELLGWTAGQFEFAAQDVPDDNPLQTTLTALLLEHARRADEAAR